MTRETQVRGHFHVEPQNPCVEIHYQEVEAEDDFVGSFSAGWHPGDMLDGKLNRSQQCQTAVKKNKIHKSRAGSCVSQMESSCL